jgi:hypothetical protein
MEEERQLVQSKLADAVRVAAGLTRRSVYDPMLKTVEERFAECGMPLHPGEAAAIAKMLTYTLDEGLKLEPGFSVEESRWFQTLCQLLAHSEAIEDLPRGELASRYLFDAALYDAVLLAFSIVQAKVREDLGDLMERHSYANRILLWFAGQGQPDLSYVYLPLVLGGVVCNPMVTNREDNPWYVIIDLREARRGRTRLLTGDAAAIFHMLDDLLDEAEDALRRARVPKP